MTGVQTRALPISGGVDVQEQADQSLYDLTSVLAYLDDNHTSVVGMREIAWQSGAKVACFARDHLCERSQITTVRDSGKEHSTCKAADSTRTLTKANGKSNIEVANIVFVMHVSISLLL